LYRGTHSLIDSCNVSRSVCLANAFFKAMPSNVDRVTATLLLQVRSHFELSSTKNNMVMELLNMCYCSVFSCTYTNFLTLYIPAIGNTTCCNYFQQVITSYYILKNRLGLSADVPHVQYGFIFLVNGNPRTANGFQAVLFLRVDILKSLFFTMMEHCLLLFRQVHLFIMSLYIKVVLNHEHGNHKSITITVVRYSKGTGKY